MKKRKNKAYRECSEFPDDKCCLLCNRNTKDPNLLGTIYKISDIYVHYLCVLSASHIEQNGTDDDGLLGFYARDIKKEAGRGAKIMCTYCKKKGATVHCFEKSCGTFFHLPCGLENDSLHHYFKTFDSFCKTHKPVQDIPWKVKNGEHECVLCSDSIDRRKQPVIWPSCCKVEVLLHKKCCQGAASNAGYDLKCPFCNNKEHFCSLLKEFGIYIPDQEATYEQELRRITEPVNCILSKSNKCKCPYSSSYSSKKSRLWLIETCRDCATGYHVGCMDNIPEPNQPFVCPDCQPILERLNGNKSLAESERTPSRPENTSLTISNRSPNESSIQDLDISSDISHTHLRNQLESRSHRTNNKRRRVSSFVLSDDHTGSDKPMKSLDCSAESVVISSDEEGEAGGFVYLGSSLCCKKCGGLKINDNSQSSKDTSGHSSLAPHSDTEQFYENEQCDTLQIEHVYSQFTWPLNEEGTDNTQSSSNLFFGAGNSEILSQNSVTNNSDDSTLLEANSILRDILAQPTSDSSHLNSVKRKRGRPFKKLKRLQTCLKFAIDEKKKEILGSDNPPSLSTHMKSIDIIYIDSDDGGC